MRRPHRHRRCGPILTDRGFAVLLLVLTSAFIGGGLLQIIRS